jgi:hypothetical protein
VRDASYMQSDVPHEDHVGERERRCDEVLVTENAFV